MTKLPYNETVRRRQVARWPVVAVALAGGSIIALAGAAAAQEGAFPLTCKDGTKLTVSFSENDAAVTLEDGIRLSLPFKSDDPFVLYSDGANQLAEKGDVLEWTRTNQAPTLCDAEDPDTPTQFDQPVAVDTLDLPADKANPDARPVVNCYRFKGFMVKEVDLGEVGAEKLAILPENAQCVRDDPDERPITGGSAGYFLGSKGHIAFFQAADGWNGGMPFMAVDTGTAKTLFQDAFAGEDFEKIEINGTSVVLDYTRTFSADCSLYLEGDACAEKIRNQTGLGQSIQLPDCGAAYEAEKKRTPDYAKEIEQLPSVISYPARLTYDGQNATIVPRAGDASCRAPD